MNPTFFKLRKGVWLLGFFGLLCLLVYRPAQAQVMSVGLGPAIAVPVNLRNNEYTFGVGGALTFKYPFTQQLHVVSQLTDYHFFASEGLNREWGFRSSNHLNVQAGVTYHFLTEKVQPYLGAHLGLSFVFLGYEGFSGGSSTLFTFRIPFSPTGGVYFKITPDFALDINVAATISGALFREVIGTRGTSFTYLNRTMIYFPVGLGFMYRIDLDSPKFQLRGG